MPNKQPEPTPRSRNTALAWAAGSLVLAVAIAGVYLGLYRAKGYRLPVGFDAPWYVWRASFVSSHGLGPLGTSTRPGSEVLAAVLGGLTGRSQLMIAVLLGPILSGVFALGLGALVWSALGADRRRWLAAVVVGGTVLGATRLVDENVATLLLLCLLLAALTALVAAAAGDGPRWAFVGSVVLLIAAGLAHWLFLAVFGLILVGAVILLTPRALHRLGTKDAKWARTEAGTLASAGLWAGAVMAASVFGLLRASPNTIQLREDPARFVPKLANDASRLRLWLLGPVAAAGAWALSRSTAEKERHERRRAVLLSLLTAWLAVCVSGIVFGLATKRLPPHRFLELAIVVPGVAAVAEAVAWASARAERGGNVWRHTAMRHTYGDGARRRMFAAVVAVVLAAVLAVPGVAAWYASGAPRPWMSAEALQEVRTAAAWLQTLKPGPFIIWVSPFGPAGTESPALKERTIRAVLPPDLQERFHMVPGNFVAYELGQPFFELGPAMRAAVSPYWRDAKPLLTGGRSLPLVLLRSLDPKDFTDIYEANHTGRLLGPGVLALPNQNGRVPQRTFSSAAERNAFPGVIPTGLWTILIVGLLSIAGFGWTRAFLGATTHPAVLFGLIPAVGAGAVVVLGTILSRAGIPLDGGGSWLVWLAAVVGGTVASWWSGRRVDSQPA